MEGCIFCAISEGRAPASVVWEDEETVAFLDIHPIARGHTLVIPRAHYANFLELEDGPAAAVLRTARKVAHCLELELQPEGLNLLQSNGRAAGQTVFHFHFHLVPRWRHDGLFLPRHALSEAASSDLKELASALRQKL